MSIPGVFPKALPEGNYTANGPIWLVGQNNNSLNQSYKFNAANLPFNGSGNGTPGINGTQWYTLSSGEPNGTVNAQNAGDLTLIEENGNVWRATASGTMSWANEGFSLKGPAGDPSNGGVNQGTPSNMSGFVYGNAGMLGAIDVGTLQMVNIPPLGADGLVIGVGGPSLCWGDAIGMWSNNGADFVIGDPTNASPIITFTPDTNEVFCTSVFYLSAVPLILADIAGSGTPPAGALAYNSTVPTVSFFDGTNWRNLALEGSGAGNASFAGDWANTTSYGLGVISFFGPQIFISTVAGTTIGNPPPNTPGEWRTLEPFAAFIFPEGTFDAGGNILGLRVILSNQTGNGTFADGTNISFAIGNLDERLLAIETLLNTFGVNGNMSVRNNDDTGGYFAEFTNGTLTLLNTIP